MDASLNGLAEGGATLRRLEPQWNKVMIAASIAISLLGTFTSTQLMVQARTSRHFSGGLVWTMLSCLVFGFCSIWSLHEVAMLACELDIQVGIDVPLTILSSVLAVVFTFAALAFDLLWDRYTRRMRRKSRRRGVRRTSSLSTKVMSMASTTFDHESSEPLLKPSEQETHKTSGHRESVELPPRTTLLQRVSLEANGDAEFDTEDDIQSGTLAQSRPNVDSTQPLLISPLSSQSNAEAPTVSPERTDTTLVDHALSETGRSSDQFSRSSSYTESNQSSFGLGNLMSMQPYRKSTNTAKNAFILTGKVLYTGCTWKNVVRSFFWSLAITSMHYCGIAALLIPQGYFTLNPILVIVSAAISWVVCLVGCIVMSQMETHLGQQFLFTIVATTGVAAMHFTGMLYHH